jgi:hypothetical protein
MYLLCSSGIQHGKILFAYYSIICQSLFDLPVLITPHFNKFRAGPSKEYLYNTTTGMQEGLGSECHVEFPQIIE